MRVKAHTLLALAVVVLVAIAAGWVIAKTVDPRITAADIKNMREDAARTAAREFLDHYLEPDGRVVRRDENGDVVSEGQAYGMLLSVAVGDETRFRSIWEWTKSHLGRPDGLLSWRWAAGQVTDVNSAADADLDAARSLLIAGRRFHDSELTNEGTRLGATLLQLETVPVGTQTPPPSDVAPPGAWVAGTGQMVVAGNWATNPPYVINPSYSSPRAEGELLGSSRDQRWTTVTRTQRVLGWQLLGTGLLPPDWAAVNDAGHATASASPAGGPVQFGLDAARLPVRFAESCDPADRALASAMRPLVNTQGDVPALRYLDGSPASDWQHPVALVAAAATEQAAGNTDVAAERLDQATALQQRYPTYYGSAWVALGRIMLATSMLGECPKPV